MGIFTPYKRHANKFNYTPRYYDPNKEERERRRQELRGERLDDSGEYTPGKYIQAKREARLSRAAEENGGGGNRMRMWAMGVGVMLLFLFIYILIPRIASIVDMATTDNSATSTQEMREVEEFDPYAPIIIVPNDYQEGDEIVIIEE
jgi:Na+-transporting methylmalonyl-CoA/oxaloacetate decarboxylase gamma subunit